MYCIYASHYRSGENCTKLFEPKIFQAWNVCFEYSSLAIKLVCSKNWFWTPIKKILLFNLGGGEVGYYEWQHFQCSGHRKGHKNELFSLRTGCFMCSKFRTNYICSGSVALKLQQTLEMFWVCSERIQPTCHTLQVRIFCS